MAELRRQRRMSRWTTPEEARRRNPWGDWALRVASATVIVPFVGLIAGAFVGGHAASIVMWWGGTAAIALSGVAVLLGLAGLSVAVGGRRSARGAVWGIGLGLVVATVCVLLGIILRA